MSEFLVDADTLANARFGTSQLTETVSALQMLSTPAEPWYRAWKDAHVTAFQRELARQSDLGGDPRRRLRPELAR